ncbi:MAG: diacylglycerol kinase family lipid kinase [Deltaproteobacteria bacterium]|nr:diacylglycerol kinase family lipid kinase [Deltaproteobacteria bacterium]
MNRASGEIAFVVNPHAAVGAVGKEWPRIEKRSRERLGSFRTYITRGPGDATHLTRNALGEGCEIIVCVGGDGTFNEVINGFMEGEGTVHPNAAVGYIARGTGCDFIKTVPLPKDLEKALDIIEKGQRVSMDLGRIEYKDNGGQTAYRYFHNVASFGLGGEVDERVNRTTKVFGGFFSFILATLISVLLYNRKHIRLTMDNGFDQMVTVLNVAVANGQYHGGGMWVSPEARVNDGKFHVTVIGDFSLPEVLWHLPKLYNGKLMGLQKVSSFTATRVEARSEERVLLDLDGEQPGRLPVTVEMAPGALKLIADGPLSPS